MKKILKAAREKTISLFYWVQWLLLSIMRVGITFSRLKAEKRGKVLILGNGPSLKHAIEDIGNKSGNAYCCVNHAIMSDTFMEIKPEYYETVDPLFFSNYFRNDKEYINKLQAIDWKMTWFVPCRVKSFAKNLVKDNKNIEVVGHPGGLYLEMRIECVRNFMFKHGIASPPAQNVVIAALYDLIMEGYKDIELYGVEHSWLQMIEVNNDNQVCLKDAHFYDAKEAKSKPWHTVTGEAFKMHTLLRALAETFEGYHDVKKFANHIGGIRIKNMTPYSYIDAFERVQV